MTRTESNRKYWKTINGKLMTTYNNMDRRVRGYTKPHIYKGLEICNRSDFYFWATLDNDFTELYEIWVESGYEKGLSPSIDRIDSSKGYTFDNMRWLTQSENSRNGAINRWKL